MKHAYTLADARRIAGELGIATDHPDFFEQLRVGMQVEREHDDVTRGDDRAVARIALAHLREDPFYYLPLLALERFRDGREQVPKVQVGLDRLQGLRTLVMTIPGHDEPLWAAQFDSTEQARSVAVFLRERPHLLAIYAWMMMHHPE